MLSKEIVQYRIIHVLLTNSVEQSPLWEVTCHSTSQEILHLVQNTNVHPQPATGLYHKPDEFTPHLTPNLFQICFNISLLIGTFLSGFRTNIARTFFISPIHVTCHTHLILLFITVILNKFSNFSLAYHQMKFNNFKVHQYFFKFYIKKVKLDRLADSREELYNVVSNATY